MGVVTVRSVPRLAIGALATAGAASFGAACGADGPTTTLERGEVVYRGNCAQCHGVDLAGSERGPSLLEPIYGPDQLSDVEFEEERWGFGPMPANGAISDAQIEAILAYVHVAQSDSAAG